MDDSINRRERGRLDRNDQGIFARGLLHLVAVLTFSSVPDAPNVQPVNLAAPRVS